MALDFVRSHNYNTIHGQGRLVFPDALLLYLIFVYNVMRAVKVRTGEEDYEDIQDVE